MASPQTSQTLHSPDNSTFNSTSTSTSKITRKEAALAEGTQTSRDKTFLSYTNEQAKAYAAGRGVKSAYNPELYDIILQHHTQTGGKLGLLLDAGCGPGNSTRDLATRFERVVGTDGSAGMINEAIKHGGDTATPGKPIEWLVSEGEDLPDKIPGIEGNVDLITVAMAAHWFDMPKFWKAAARLLKPGGTVAIWTRASAYVHPSMPNAKELQAILSRLEDEVLGPYATPGNWMSRTLYTNLPLPWTCSPPVPGFSESTYFRQEWNKDGQCDVDKPFFAGDKEEELENFAKSLKTASMYTRWYEANKDDVLAGRKRDCRDEMADEVKKILPAGNTKLRLGYACVLMMVKKE